MTPTDARLTHMYRCRKWRSSCPPVFGRRQKRINRVKILLKLPSNKLLNKALNGPISAFNGGRPAKDEAQIMCWRTGFLQGRSNSESGLYLVNSIQKWKAEKYVNVVFLNVNGGDDNLEHSGILRRMVDHSFCGHGPLATFQKANYICLHTKDWLTIFFSPAMSLNDWFWVQHDLTSAPCNTAYRYGSPFWFFHP